MKKKCDMTTKKHPKISCIQTVLEIRRMIAEARDMTQVPAMAAELSTARADLVIARRECELLRDKYKAATGHLTGPAMRECGELHARNAAQAATIQRYQAAEVQTRIVHEAEICDIAARWAKIGERNETLELACRSLNENLRACRNERVKLMDERDTLMKMIDQHVQEKQDAKDRGDRHLADLLKADAGLKAAVERARVDIHEALAHKINAAEARLKATAEESGFRIAKQRVRIHELEVLLEAARLTCVPNHCTHAAEKQALIAERDQLQNKLAVAGFKLEQARVEEIARNSCLVTIEQAVAERNLLRDELALSDFKLEQAHDTAVAEERCLHQVAVKKMVAEHDRERDDLERRLSEALMALERKRSDIRGASQLHDIMAQKNQELHNCLEKARREIELLRRDDSRNECELKAQSLHLLNIENARLREALREKYTLVELDAIFRVGEPNEWLAKHDAEVRVDEQLWAAARASQP